MRAVPTFGETDVRLRDSVVVADSSADIRSGAGDTVEVAVLRPGRVRRWLNRPLPAVPMFGERNMYVRADVPGVTNGRAEFPARAGDSVELTALLADRTRHGPDQPALPVPEFGKSYGLTVSVADGHAEVPGCTRDSDELTASRSIDLGHWLNGPSLAIPGLGEGCVVSAGHVAPDGDAQCRTLA